MAETLVKNQVCSACGSEVRQHAQFCFHCGGQLEVVDPDGNGEPSDVWFREEIAEETDQNVKTDRADISKAEAKDVGTPDENRESEESGLGVEESELKLEADEGVKVKPKPFVEQEKKSKKKNRKKKSDLKSAATLRKRSKPSRLKMVEIVWEERENSSNPWFIVFALLLSLLVAGLVAVAFYLK